MLRPDEGRRAGEIAALEGNAPLPQGQKPENAAHGRGLAHAVAPEQRYDFAARHFEIDAEQHLRLAVARLDRLDAQHHANSSSPR